MRKHEKSISNISTQSTKSIDYDSGLLDIGLSIQNYKIYPYYPMKMTK
jgi:hypothetical protein